MITIIKTKIIILMISFVNFIALQIKNIVFFKLNNYYTKYSQNYIILFSSYLVSDLIIGFREKGFLI